MKKLLALVLATALICPLCACGPSGGTGDASSAPPAQSLPAPDSPPAASADAPDPRPVQPQPAPEPTQPALKSFSPEGLWYLWQASLMTFDSGTGIVTIDNGSGPDNIVEGSFTYDQAERKLTVTESGGAISAMTLSPTDQEGLFQVLEPIADGAALGGNEQFFLVGSGDFTSDGEWVLYWASPSSRFRALDFSQRTSQVLSAHFDSTSVRGQTFYWPEYRYSQSDDTLYFSVDGTITAELALKRGSTVDLVTVDDNDGDRCYFALVPARDQNAFRSDFTPEGTWSGSIKGATGTMTFRFDGDIPDIASIQYDGSLVEYNDENVDRRDIYPYEYDADNGILTTYTASGSVRDTFYIVRLDGELRLYLLQAGEDYDYMRVGTPSGLYYSADENKYAVLTRN